MARYRKSSSAKAIQPRTGMARFVRQGRNPSAELARDFDTIRGFAWTDY
jgi:hypothetical protein